MKQAYLGFTIFEVLIALAVIAVLGAIAIPAYHDYFRRLHFKNDIIQSLSPYQVAVEKCYQTQKSLKGCDAGRKNIPVAINKPKDKIASLTISNGVISVVPVSTDGMTSQDTYILTPSIANDTISWKSSGGAVTDGYAD